MFRILNHITVTTRRDQGIYEPKLCIPMEMTDLAITSNEITSAKNSKQYRVFTTLGFYLIDCAVVRLLSVTW